MEEAGVIAAPPGFVAATEAEFTTEPALRSVWVTTCVPVQVVKTPGARVVTGHEIPVTMASVTTTLEMVTLPVLVTLNVYESV